MAVLKLTSLGGTYPAVLARNLPDNAAQIALNLLASTPEFRPLPADLVVATAATANPKTLYRLQRTSSGAFSTDMTTGWITKPTVVQFVKSQIDDDATERTYYTQGDGSAAPRAMNALGADRLLGLPAPAVQPVVAAAIVDEFTADERGDAILASTTEIVKTIQDHLEVAWVGGDDPAAIYKGGYVNNQLDYWLASNQPQKLRLYKTSSTNSANNGTLTESYTSRPIDSFSGWVFNPITGARWVKATGPLPAWTGWSPGVEPDFIAIPYYAYGRAFNIKPGLAAALLALKRPGSTTEPLLNADRVTGPDGLIDYVTKWASQTDERGKDKIAALRNKVIELEALMDGGTAASANAAMTAFYASANITTLFENIFINTADQIFAAAQNIAIPWTPPEQSPGGSV